MRRVREQACGPLAGVFGPDSLRWRVDREAALFLGAGRALLLQLAHPWVAAAIAEHSRTLADPVGRFHRTFAMVFTLVFGSLDAAIGAATRLHRRHDAIQGIMPESAGRFASGSPYAANETAALCWVWATLTETALLAYEIVLPPLTLAERERYYAESRIFAGMFGLAEASLPADWAAFRCYCAEMLESDTLAVGSAATALAEQLLGRPIAGVRMPLWYRALTAELLPPRMRDAFGLPFGPAEQRRAQRARVWLRRSYAMLPHRLRRVGPYQEAAARLRGLAPDRITRQLNRLWIGRDRLPG